MISEEKDTGIGTFLEVQWLRLSASIAGGCASIPCRGTKIPRAAHSAAKKIKNKRTKVERE